MKKYLALTLLPLLFGAPKVEAAIWQDYNSWSMFWEQQYSNWMRSHHVREKMFTDRNSPYYGINPDCADTAYALRIIFSYENKLPFAIINPSGNRGLSPSLNNKSKKYDRLPSELARVKALIEEVGSSVGTENLTRFDSYPVSIDHIVPGSLFTYKIDAQFKNSIRHAYNIKDINPVGSFDVIYSTQANQKIRGDLLRRKDFEFFNLPSDPWGFRRFKWPEHIGKPLSVIPFEMGASQEQFELANRLGRSGFFRYVKQRLATAIENPSDRMDRLLEGVCFEGRARVGYVQDAINHLRLTGNRCMNYQDFDAFSTPARDKAIQEQFLKLRDALSEAVRIGHTFTMTYDIVNYIFNGIGHSGIEQVLLKKCSISYKPGQYITLRDYWLRSNSGRMSSHPNDSLEVRWGERTSPKTNCRSWY